VGDPTEGALIVLAGKAGVTAESVRADLPRLAVLPFDSTRKLMATVTEDPFGGPGRLLAVKGGSDVVFGRCTAMLVADGIADLDEARRAGATEVMRSLGADGLRVLAIAGKELAADWDGDPDDELDDLVLYGVVGILDPPRPEAGVAIAECRDAGIAVKMITGDHATTAAAIGQQLGLDGEVVTGAISTR
jgi:Ca2+-transporting ATPase